MQRIIRRKSSFLLTSSWMLFLGFLVAMPACVKPPEPARQYGYIYLVSNSAVHLAARTDPNFVNGWGIAFSPTGVAWVSVAGPAGISAVLNKQGGEQIAGGVKIPSPGDSTQGGHPSGQIFNGTSDFKLANGNPARFIFAGLEGIISGWNGGGSAKPVLDNSKGGAVYTGIAMAQDAGSNFLYAANFSAGKIQVFDRNWAEVNKPFQDPDLPAGYSPFNIQNINGRLFVMYAKVAPNGEETKGAGLGFVDIYNPDGSLARRFASRGPLNAPWGVAEAPAGFWDSDDGNILIGNFGDGRISVYNKWGIYVGQIKRNGQPLVIGGLWGISFPPSTATTVEPRRLYFAGGPDDEKNGVFGYIKLKGDP